MKPFQSTTRRGSMAFHACPANRTRLDDYSDSVLPPAAVQSLHRARNHGFELEQMVFLVVVAVAVLVAAIRVVAVQVSH